MLEHTNSVITIAYEDLFYSDKDVFGSENGLSVAIALIDYDSNEEEILDKSYGEFVFNTSVWGLKEDGSIFWFQDEMESYPCSKEEIGVDIAEPHRFNPVTERSQSIVRFKQTSFKCWKEEDSYIYGDYSSD